MFITPCPSSLAKLHISSFSAWLTDLDLDTIDEQDVRDFERIADLLNDAANEFIENEYNADTQDEELEEEDLSPTPPPASFPLLGKRKQ